MQTVPTSSAAQYINAPSSPVEDTCKFKVTTAQILKLKKCEVLESYHHFNCYV